MSCFHIMSIYTLLPSVLWHCWLGGRKGIRPVKKPEWWGAWLSVWSEVQVCVCVCVSDLIISGHNNPEGCFAEDAVKFYHVKLARLWCDVCLQCFDAVGWAAGRASGLWKTLWLFLWSEMQTCIWPSWCHCHSSSLASVKSRLVLPFWHRLTRVDPEKGPLNGCVCVCDVCWKFFELGFPWLLYCK